MQNLSSNQKQHLYEGGHVGVTVTGETLDGDPIALTEDDIIEGSFSIERNWTSGSTIEIGCADTSELIFELDNSDGRWSNIRWEGARLVVVLDIAGEPLQAGVFTVDEPPRKLTTMQIRALDDMARFNRPYEPGIVYPASLKQILLDCCQQCGVTLYTLEFDNGDYVVAQRPDGDDITFHHVVAWVAELAGCNAWMDHLARLQLSWYGDQQPEPAQLEFTRPSPAIHPETGEEIPANTPVYVDFAAGKKGSLMEEGTTNAFNNPSFEDGTTGWGTIGFDDDTLLTSVTDDVYSGSKAVKVERVSGGLSRTGATISQSIGTRIVLTQNQSVTVSFYVKGKGNTIGKTVRAHIYASDGANIVSQWKLYTLTGEWQRISYTLTWPYATSTTTIYGYCRAENINIGDYFYVDAAQLEQKPYATSFIDGTRANPVKRITLPEPLPAEFGIGVTMKMLWGANDPAAEGVYRWAAELWIDYGNRIFIGWQHTQKRWRAEVWVGGEMRTSTITDTPNFTAGDIIGLYFERRTDRFRLAGRFAGGEIIFADWRDDYRQWPDHRTINVGCGGVAGASPANAIFADFVLHDRPEDIDPEGYLAGVPDDADGGGES